MEKNFITRLSFSIVYLYVLLFSVQTLSAQSQTTRAMPSQDYLVHHFIENKGQLPDSILFDCPTKNGHFYFMKNGFIVSKTQPLPSHKSFHQEQIDSNARRTGKTENDLSIVKGHNYQIRFDHYNLGSTLRPQRLIATRFNYILNTVEKEITASCAAYQTLVYENVYAGIDVRFFVHNQQLKYDIVVHPNGNIKDFSFGYSGVENMRIHQHKLVYETSLETIEEDIPESFLHDGEGKKEMVKVRYALDKNVVRFQIKNYAKNKTLTIDPTLVFASFSGSPIDNWGFTSTYGADGSFYLGGIVFASGYNTSIGAFQLSFGGGARGSSSFVPSTGLGGSFPTDAVIMKFNATGTEVLYATYLGGQGDELPNSLIEDSKGNLLILGRTSSGTNFPRQNRSSYGSLGSTDIFITKLNVNGSAVVKSWLIGGSGADGVNVFVSYISQRQTETNRFYSDMSRGEIILDEQDNIYVLSQTQSANFPTFAAFQNTFGGGTQDAAFVKISPDMNTILCSSFLGGNRTDAGFVLNYNKQNNMIYLAGTTMSANFPGDKTGVLQSTLSGPTDGFVSRISNTNYTLEKTTFIGTPSNDYLYGIRSDKNGNIYIMGVTEGNWNVVNSAYNIGYGKQFIAKLPADLDTYIYTTRFGTNSIDPNISPVAFAVDRCENLYIAGFGQTHLSERSLYRVAGTTGLPVSADAIKKTTDGGDFYFIVFEKNANRILYSTFYGITTNTFGDHVDGGTSRFDPNGVIYQAICASCSVNSRYPTTPGVIFPSKGAPIEECNMLGVKIDFNLSGVVASLNSEFLAFPSAVKACFNSTILFVDTKEQGERYEWNFDDGTGNITTTVPKINHAFARPGRYNVRLVSFRASTCNGSDTSFRVMTITENKVQSKMSLARDSTRCDVLKVNFKNLSAMTENTNIEDSLFKWNYGDGTQEILPKKNHPTHIYAKGGQYTVTLTVVSQFCNESQAISTIFLLTPTTTAAFSFPHGACLKQNVTVNNTSVGADEYFWYVDGNLFSKEQSPTFLFIQQKPYIIQLKTVNSFSCNKIDSMSLTIIPLLPPQSNFSVVYESSEQNLIPKFINQSTNATLYTWNFGDSTSIVTTQKDTLLYHFYKNSTTYLACLTAHNQNCFHQTCKNISIALTPTVLSPNAFTPNGDGINDKFFVRVIGGTFVQKKIYNRWGQLVFETTKENEAWDGTYLGKLQAPDAYNFVVEYQTETGQVNYYKGSITLIQ